MAENEPKEIKKRACWKNSFLPPGTPVNYNSPEEFILELYRLIFFKNRLLDKEPPPSIYAFDGDDDLEKQKKLCMLAFSGRKKEADGGKKNVQKDNRFYALPYPQLASKSSQRKKDGQPLRDFFVQGIIAQYVFRPGAKRVNQKEKEFKADCKKIINSLSGRSKQDDIFYLAMNEKVLGDIDQKSAENKLFNLVKDSSNEGTLCYDTILEDNFSKTIYDDFINLCDLQETIPRFNWIQLLLGYFSVSSTSWLLAHMKYTKCFHKWLKDSLIDKKIPEIKIINEKFENRNRDLFQVSQAPSRELYEHIESYAKARVETLIIIELLVDLNIINGDEAIPSRPAKLNDYLKNISLKNKDLLDGLNAKGYKNINQYIAREREKYKNWLTPRANGIGKLISEFLRVLHKKAFVGINDSYTLEQVRPKKSLSRETWCKINLGPLTVQLFVFLAMENKKKSGLRGHLTINELINHISIYGIEFGQSDDATNILKDELKIAGLIIGSPDAGKSARVGNPFS